MGFLFDPNVAYLLLISGTLVLIVALLTPGTGLLELTAVFLLLLAGYSATQLAVNIWAIALWGIGIVFFGLSVRRTKHTGLWLALALLAMTVGSVFIFRTPLGGSAVSPWLAATASFFVGGFGWIVTRKILEAESQPPAHDLNRLLGQIGEARTAIAPEGTVFVAGEMWTARSQQPIAPGQMVRVVAREGLILLVEPVPSASSETHTTQA